MKTAEQREHRSAQRRQCRPQETEEQRNRRLENQQETEEQRNIPEERNIPVIRVTLILCSPSIPCFWWATHPKASRGSAIHVCISKVQFDQESGRRRIALWMCHLQTLIYFIYIYVWKQPVSQALLDTISRIILFYIIHKCRCIYWHSGPSGRVRLKIRNCAIFSG